MGPKKATTAAPKKAAAAPAHASYLDMVKDAIINLKERNGSSRQAIQKYIKANNNLGDVTDAMFKSHVNRAIASGDKNGTFTRPKGASGTVKLAQKKPAPAKKEKEPKAPTEKKEKKAPAATKAKKPAATKAKTAATKKTTAKAPKKTTAAAKPKANASKPRKTAAPAPAVEAEVSRVLGKTKSGRVTKSQAPAAAAKPKKTAAAKKAAAPKKAAAAKKAATPKKATPKKAEVGSAPRSVGRPRKST